MMPRLALWGLAILVVAALADRLLLWMESKGWISCRRTKGRGGGALYHTLEMHSVFDPGIQEVIELKYKDEQSQDESGEPPVPDLHSD